MSDTPRQGPGSGDNPDEEPTNPFKGTPFEALFGAGGMPGSSSGIGFTATPGGGGPGGGMPDLAAIMQQVQALMQPHDGPVNWSVATDMARKAVASAGEDPSTSTRQADALADAVRLADHWLDETTDFPSGVTSTAAWSRAEWVEQTMDVWKVLVEPIAEGSVAAMGSALPEEARAAGARMRALLPRRLRRALVDDGRWLQPEARAQLQHWVDQRPRIRTLVEYRAKLADVLEARSHDAGERLRQLQAWCQEAEASGIRALQDYSARLKGYALQPARG